jgi:hypothetical protein
VKFRRARRAVPFLLLLAGLVGVTPLAWGQYASKTGDVVGTVGGACTTSANTYGWPDVNGDVLKCVSNVWTLVTQSVAAAGSTGYVQFNNANALAADSNLFWDNTNKRLGIGMTSPQSALDVNGNITIDASTNGAGSGAKLTFSRAADGWIPAQIQPIYEGSSYNGALLFYTNGGGNQTAYSEKMRITAAGNVGIGTTAPSAPLEIANSSGTGIGLYLNGTAYGGKKWALGDGVGPANGTFTIKDATAGSVRLVIDTSGNVGIGTTARPRPNSRVTRGHLQSDILDKSSTNIWAGMSAAPLMAAALVVAAVISATGQLRTHYAMRPSRQWAINCGYFAASLRAAPFRCS